MQIQGKLWQDLFLVFCLMLVICVCGIVWEGLLHDLSRIIHVKPTRAGSSIGVTVAYGVTDALTKASEIVSEGIDDRVIVEIFLGGGSEFTAIVLDVGSAFDSQPVVLLPTEVELQSHGTVDVGEKDINLISGMEQTSFLFQQASKNVEAVFDTAIKVVFQPPRRKEMARQLTRRRRSSASSIVVI